MGALDAWGMSIANAKTKTFFFHKENLEPIEIDYTTTSQLAALEHTITLLFEQLITGAETRFFPGTSEHGS